MVSNIRVEGNIIESARLDGIKMFQARNVSVVGNTIRASGMGGAAGSAGNRNGDGGVDWVQVLNSEMFGNIISSRGWACVMVKTGSGNNRITNNNLVSCEVNGIDMSAPSTGRAAAANRSGFAAFNTTISGNQVQRGRGCAVNLGDDTRNIRVTDNDLNGPNCNRGATNGPGVTGAGDSSNSGGDAGESGDNGDSALQSALLQQVSMSSGSDCGSSSGTISTAGSIISGILGGGRATLPAQIAQQVQLIFQSVCAARQLAAQLKMLQTLGINTVGDVEAAMILVQDVLGVSQRVAYELARADADWQRVFMEVTGIREMPSELTFPAMGERYSEMREFANEALMEAARVRSLAVTNMKSGNERVRSVANASAAAVGPTQAVQAGNLLMLETSREIQGMHQTVLSYNEAQSRIDQEKRVQGVLAGIFMEKNMESMNPTPTPPQGSIIWNGENQRTVQAPLRSASGETVSQRYDPFSLPTTRPGFGSGSNTASAGNAAGSLNN